MPSRAVKAEERAGSVRLPFGYRAQRAGERLILRRPDGSFVTAFLARDADPFELEAAVWEDAD